MVTLAATQNDLTDNIVDVRVVEFESPVEFKIYVDASNHPA
jgi:hypothetical protein